MRAATGAVALQAEGSGCKNDGAQVRAANGTVALEREGMSARVAGRGCEWQPGRSPYQSAG